MNFFWYLAFFYIPLPCYGIVYGSNTAVSRQTAITFPAVDGDNEMRGFAVFENGFTLEDNTTVCTYNNYFPILGPIDLNGGTLLLSQDLTLDGAATFVDSGIINGNNHTLDLPNNISVFSIASPMTFTDLTLFLHSDVMLSAQITFNGSCVLEGGGYSLNCTTAGGILIGSGADLKIKDAVLKDISGTQIACSSSTSKLSLEDVSVVLDGNYTFDQGYFEVSGQCNLIGPHIFTYMSNQTSTIKSNSTLFFDAGMTFSYAPSSATKNLLNFSDASSRLYLYETSLYSTTTGLQLTKGTLIVDGLCPISSDATVEAEAIIFGDGSLNNDLTIKLLPESGFDLTSGFLLYKNVN